MALALRNHYFNPFAAHNPILTLLFHALCFLKVGFRFLLWRPQHVGAFGMWKTVTRARFKTESITFAKCCFKCNVHLTARQNVRKLLTFPMVVLPTNWIGAGSLTQNQIILQKTIDGKCVSFFAFTIMDFTNNLAGGIHLMPRNMPNHSVQIRVNTLKLVCFIYITYFRFLF